jgi:hypothetical protein
MLQLFYFSLGFLLQLPSLGIRLYLLQTMHRSISEIGVIESVIVVPWCLKPIYGAISDRYPLFGHRRKYYIVGSTLLTCVLWAVMSRTGVSVVALFVVSASTCWADVMYDAILVAKAREETEHGNLQSLCWAARSLGSLLASLLSGYMLHALSASWVFVMTSLIAGLTAIAAWFLVNDSSPATGSTFSATKRALCSPGVFYPTLFVFLFVALPTSGDALFVYLVDDRNFTPVTLGYLDFAGQAATLLGTLVYRRWFRRTAYRKFFKYVIVLAAVVSCLPLLLVEHINRHIPDAYFAGGDNVFAAAISQMASMPCLIMAAKLCPPGVEGTFYATLVAIMNFAGLLSELGGSLIAYMFSVTAQDFKHLELLLVTCTVLSLLPLFFLNLLPGGNVDDVVRRG